MTGDATVRRAEDVDFAALTDAEVKAIGSGNPLVIEKASIDAEAMRLTRLKKQHAESLYQMRYRIKRLGDTMGILECEIANIREDPAYADSHARRQLLDDGEERNIYRPRESRARSCSSWPR